jgi:hypothetical protein
MASLVGIMLAATSCSANSSGEDLTLGAKYEIIRPVYLEGVYNSLDDRKISPEKATAYLTGVKYAKRSEVAFQVEVPAGTVMTVVSSASRVIHLPYIVDQYHVRLTPDVSRGLDVLLSLDRGLEGDLDGLNSQIFRRINE